MASIDHERLVTVFLAACELPAQQRPAYLDEACGTNARLRAEVEALLARDTDDVGIRTEPPSVTADLPDGAAAPSAEMPETVGPYRLLQVIGRGGMGVVYLAEQREPVERRVALKIIKLGMDTEEILARFATERQALAMMDHANVARLYDAGATETGRPYFVMEYVPGIPITEYGDRHRLNVRHRLELFLQVCEAVQHAHQKGIIHRDIKPSNVLVAPRESGALVKVIDFGIAKATSRRLTDRTIYTEQGQLIGTPEYMSPEQAEMTAHDIDTRTDVYALGVLLYELLTGALPFAREALLGGGPEGMRQLIREEEPPRPSVRLHTLGDGATDSARKRWTDVRSLVRTLRGDLDWIAMKAMEKDRTRRYSAASELAADVRRHLEGRPVLAGPPSAMYRFRKFVRRNRPAVAAGVVAAASLVVATGTSLWFALNEAEQRRIASRERDIASAVNDFLTKDLLAAVAPSVEENRGRDVLMRDVLDEAAESISRASADGGRFADKPLVEASIRETLGMTYRGLGAFDAAEPHMERTLALRRRLSGAAHEDTLRAMINLATLYADQGRYDEAVALHEEAIELCRRHVGDEHRMTLRVMANLARVHQGQGRYDDVERAYSALLDVHKRALGETDPDTLGVMNNLAVAYTSQGRYEEAERLYKEVLALERRALGAEHPITIRSLTNLANVYGEMGRYEDAEAVYEEALAAQRRVLGDEHRLTLTTMGNLASQYGKQGRYEEAERLLRELLEIRRRVLGEEHPDTVSTLSSLGTVYGRQGRYQEAERVYAEALGIQRRVLGRDHPRTLTTMMNLANIYTEHGRYEETEHTYLELLALQKRALGENHPSTLASMHNLAMLYSKQGRWDEAEPLQTQTVEIKKRVLGPEHPDTLLSIMNLAVTCNEQGRHDEAERIYLELIESQKRVLGEEHPYVLLSMNNLAEVYFQQDMFQRAAALQAEAVEAARAAWPDGSWFTGAFLAAYGKTLTAQRRYGEAETVLLEAHDILTATLGEADEQTAAVAESLVDLYESWGRSDEAARWRSTAAEPSNTAASG